MTALLDVSVPSPARVRDYWLGGKSNFQADRDMAAQLLSVWPDTGHLLPGPREMAMRNRRFLNRAVTWAATQGVSQFIDFGCGLPVPPPLLNTHVAARDGRDGARCVYVDSDDMVISHARALLGGDGITVTQAATADIATVLGSGIDLSEPCGLIFGMLTHRMPACRAREIISAYLAAVPAGSYLIISTLQCGDRALWEQIHAAYTAGHIIDHPPADAARFFTGTQLVPPGLTTAKAWRPEWTSARLEPDMPLYALCGVGVKE